MWCVLAGLFSLPVAMPVVSRSDIDMQIRFAQPVSFADGSVREIAAGTDGLNPSTTEFQKGMSKAEVLAVVKGDWAGRWRIPNKAAQMQDTWEITEPWLRGEHVVCISFINGMVDEITESWLSP